MRPHMPLLLGLVMLTGLVQGTPEHSYRLVAIEDGDTVTVQIGNEVTRLQLSGIDAPEDVVNPKLLKDLQRTGMTTEALLDLGKKATAHLKQLVAPGDTVRVAGDLTVHDRYGRIPVFLYTHGDHSLNEQMVADGYAILLSRSPASQQIKERFLLLEKQAQQQKRGLWGSDNRETLSWSGQHPSK